MHTVITRRTTLALVSSVAVATGLLTSAPAATAGSSTPRHPYVVASGLDNPRHLTFGPNGILYVAESGRGGPGPCTVASEGDKVCLGRTGAVSAVWPGRQWRVVTGLPSIAGPDGSSASGPSDVALAGNRRIAISIGLGAPPAARAALGPGGAKLGTVVAGRIGRPLPVLADLAAYEGRRDPDRAGPDSNPSALIRRGDRYVVADAGGNDLLRIGTRGRISTLAVFPERLVNTPPGSGLPPKIAMQAVPTGVAVGPDGAYYVSQLTGFPFPVGESKIWRVVPGQAPKAFASGFTNVTDLTWANGKLYVVQLADGGLLSAQGLPMGSLIEVRPWGGRRVVAKNLQAPYGVAVKGKTAYVTTCSVCAGGGTVRAIPLR